MLFFYEKYENGFNSIINKDIKHKTNFPKNDT